MQHFRTQSVQAGRLLLFFLLWSVPAASAQGVCPALTDAEIEVLAAQCSGLGAGEVCTPDQPVAPPGQDAMTAPALLTLPGAFAAALIGDATLEAAEPVERAVEPVRVTNAGREGINLREGAGRDFAVVGVLAAGADAEVDGRSEDSQWLRLTEGGWVFAQLVVSDAAFDSLPVVAEDDASDDAAVENMAAFTLVTSACEQSGLLLHARSEGAVTINGLPLSWQATSAFVRAGSESSDGSENTLDILVTEGELMVIVNDEPESVAAGERLLISPDGVERSEYSETDLETWALPFQLVTPAAGTPEEVVYRYLEARTAGDSDEMLALSCASWDAQASIQAQSFRAMSAQLQGVTCSTGTISDDEAVVTCDGVIRTSYNGQTRDFPLSGYSLVQEEGEWRICGEAD